MKHTGERTKPKSVVAPHGQRSRFRISPTDLLLLLAVVFLWALCYPLIRMGLAFAPPLHFAAIRAGLAGASLVALCFLTSRPMPQGLWVWVGLVGVGLSATSVGFAGMFLGGGYVTPGLATVLANAQPLMAAGIGYLVLSERLHSTQAIALLTGFVGITIIAIPRMTASPEGSSGTGIGFVLVAALGVAVGNVLLKKLAGRADPVAAMGWQFLIGAIPLFLTAWLVEASESVRWYPEFVLTLSALSILGTAVAFVLWFSLLQRYELNRLNTFTFLTPVFALSLGALFFAERLSAPEWMGTTLVVAAAILASKAGARGIAAAQEQTARSSLSDEHYGKMN